MPSTSIEGYPSQYESRLTLKNGSEVFLRPILNTDGPLLVELFNMLSPQSVYFRFLSSLKALSEALLYQFTNINYDSAFALVAVVKEDGKNVIIAVGRYAFDPQDNVTDLAVAVRDDWQHLGLGKSLLQKIITIGKEHGISRFVCTIHPQNDAIKQTFKTLGYEVKYSLRGAYNLVEIFV
ncbi:MAG: GNAT family N-acetyltransferase [Deltaproteobacteria bacterium]|nr:GNAT family N-acetyltransferase [Deltaproteobacteria bacterium]